MNAPLAHVPIPSRKAQALSFITAFLSAKGHSPTMTEIGLALGVSPQRAKELVHRLAQDGSVLRAPGAQRGISVPGMTRSAALDQLRAEGWTIVDGLRELHAPGALVKGHLPIVAILEHDPTLD